jgi:DNA topoisomerase II
MKIDNRVRFVTEIIEGKLIVQNRKRSELLIELKNRNFDPIYKKATSVDENDDQIAGDGGYDYLLSMPIWNLTWEKVQNLIREKEQKEVEIKILLGETPASLWRADLTEFKTQWEVI